MGKIKVYVKVDEYNNTHYYTYFTIVDRKYHVGDIYDHEEVKRVEAIRPDFENDSDVFNHDLFKIETTLDGEYNEEMHKDFYIAVRIEDAPV